MSINRLTEIAERAVRRELVTRHVCGSVFTYDRGFVWSEVRGKDHYRIRQVDYFKSGYGTYEADKKGAMYFLEKNESVLDYTEDLRKAISMMRERIRKDHGDD
jgi:hypothetical protein